MASVARCESLALLARYAPKRMKGLARGIIFLRTLQLKKDMPDGSACVCSLDKKNTQTRGGK